MPKGRSCFFNPWASGDVIVSSTIHRIQHNGGESFVEGIVVLSQRRRTEACHWGWCYVEGSLKVSDSFAHRFHLPVMPGFHVTNVLEELC